MTYTSIYFIVLDQVLYETSLTRRKSTLCGIVTLYGAIDICPTFANVMACCLMASQVLFRIPGLILGLRPANEDFVTTLLIGWTQT